MNKKYTRKQILESIAYWKKQLNESIDNESIVILFEKDGLTNYDYQSYAAFNNDSGIPVNINKQGGDYLWEMALNCKEGVESEFRDNGFVVKVVAMEFEPGPHSWSINIKCIKPCDKAAMNKFLNYTQEVYT